MLAVFFFTVSLISCHLLCLDASPDIELPSSSVRATSFPHSLLEIKLLDLDDEPIELISLEVAVENGAIDDPESFPGLWIRRHEDRTIITGIASDIQMFLNRGKLMMVPPTPRWMGRASVYLKVFDPNNLILAEKTLHVIIDPDVIFQVEFSPHYMSIDEDQSFLFKEFNLTLSSSAEPTEILSCEIAATWGELTGIDLTNVSISTLKHAFPSYLYRPKPHFTGLDTVHLSCETIDGQSDDTKFEIEIYSINDYPNIFLGSKIISVEEDVPISLSKTGLRFDDADIEGGEEVLIAVDLELRIGSIELPPVSMLGGLSSIINSPNRICIAGELNRINFAMRNIAIMFPPNWHGTDVLSIKCTDSIEFQLLANTSVIDNWQTALVSFVVADVNDAPTITVEPRILFDMSKGNVISLNNHISLSDVDGRPDENYTFNISLSKNENMGKLSGSIAFDASLIESNVTTISKEDYAVEVQGNIIELSKFVNSLQIVFEEKSLLRAPQTTLSLFISDASETMSFVDISIVTVKKDVSLVENENNFLTSDNNYSWSYDVRVERYATAMNKSPVVSYPILIDKIGVDGTHFLEIRELTVRDDEKEEVLIVSMVLVPDHLGHLKQSIPTEIPVQKDEVSPGRYTVLAKEKLLNEALSSLVVEVNEEFSGEGELFFEVFDSAGSSGSIVINLLVTKQVEVPTLVLPNRTLFISEDEKIEFKTLCYFDHDDAVFFNTERFEVEIETESRHGSDLAGVFQFHMKQIIGGIHFPLQDLISGSKESVVMRGSLASLNNALEQLVLIPPSNFHGEIIVKIEVRGGNLASYLGSTFNIIIVPVDDVPDILWFGNLMNETIAFVEIDEDDLALIKGITIEDPDVNSSDVSVTLLADIGSLCYTDNEAKVSNVDDSAIFTFYEGERFYCPNDGESLSFTDNIYGLNERLQSILYVPSENWWGRDIISIEVDSQNKKCSGLINVIVAATDDNPIILVPEPPFASIGPKYVIEGIKVYDADVDQLLKWPNGLCLSTPSVCHITVEITTRYGIVTVKEIQDTSSYRSSDGKFLIRGTVDAINRSFEQLLYTQLGNHGGTEILNISVTDREGNQDTKAICLALHSNHRAPTISILIDNNILEMEEDRMLKIGYRDICDDYTGNISCQLININDCDDEEKLHLTLESQNGLIQTPEILSIHETEGSFKNISAKDFVDMIQVEANPHILNQILGNMYFRPNHNFNSIGGHLASIYITVKVKTGLIAKNKVNIYVKSRPDKPVIEKEPQFDDDDNNTVLVEKDKSAKISGIRVHDADSTYHNHLLQTNLSATIGYVCIIGNSPVRQWIVGYRNQCLRNVVFQSSVDKTNKIFQELIYRPEKEFVGDDNVTIHISDLSNEGQHDEEILNISIRVFSEGADLKVIGPEIIQMKEDETAPINIFIATTKSWLSSEIAVSISCEHGTLQIPEQTNLTLQAFKRSVIGTGTIKAWNDALRGLKYRPDENWNSNYEPLEVIDLSIDANNIAVGNPILKHKIFISVEATPDAPTWNIVSGTLVVDPILSEHNQILHRYEVFCDQSIPIVLSLDDPDIVEEYSDPLLTVQASSSAGACIELDNYQEVFIDEKKCEKIQFKGTLKMINTAVYQLKYTPPHNYIGQDSVSFFASDGSLNVTTTILILVSTRDNSFPDVSSTTGQCIEQNTLKRDMMKTSNENHVPINKQFVSHPNQRVRIVDLSTEMPRYSFEKEKQNYPRYNNIHEDQEIRRCRAHKLCSVGNFSIEGDESLIYKLEISVTLGSIVTTTHLLDIDTIYNQMQTRLQMIGDIATLNAALRHLKYKPRATYETVDTMFFILSSLSIPDIFDTFLSSLSLEILVEVENNGLSLVAPSSVLFMDEDEIISIVGVLAYKSPLNDDKNKLIQASIVASEGSIRISHSLSKLKIHPVVPNYDEMWWNDLAICGTVQHVNSSVAKMSFKPIENWNSDAGDVVRIYVHVATTDDCEMIGSVTNIEDLEDTTLIPLYVKPVNDGPVISLESSAEGDILMSGNGTLVVKENVKVRVPFAVQDVDSDIIKVEIKSQSSGMFAVSLGNLRNIDAFFLEGDCGGDFYPNVSIQGTITGVNIVLQNIYFMGKETNEYIEVIASDLIGEQDTLNLTVYVQPAAVDLLLWFVVNADFKRPIPVFQEYESRLLGSDLIERKDLYMEAEMPKHIVGPKYKVRRLSGPRIFTLSIGSDEDALKSDVRVCVKVVTDQGIIRIQRTFKSILFETAQEGKELRYIGGVFAVNKASEAIIFDATDGVGGQVTLEITAVKGHCQMGTNRCYCNFDIPDARKGLFHLQVNRLNSSPKISWLRNDYTRQPLTSNLDSLITLSGLHIQDPDASEDGILTIKITASKGVLSLSSIQDLSFMKGTGSHDRDIEVLGTLRAINDALDELVYICRAVIDGCQSGSNETIYLQVSDNGFHGYGFAKEDKATLFIEIL